MDWCAYFRCKEEQPFTDILNEIAEHALGYNSYPVFEVNEEDLKLKVAVCYKLGYPGEPGWLGFLSLVGAGGLQTGVLGRAHNALVAVDLNGIVYILAFGSAHTIPKKLNIERRFGKIAVSNGKLQDEVRGITAKVHGVAGKVRIERRGKGGPTGELEVPRRANMASGIAAKVLLGETNHVADGSASIRTVAPTSIETLILYLTQLEGWWNSGIELDPNLAALDRIVEVRDRLLLTNLNVSRENAIRNNQTFGFSLCLEDDQLWEATNIEYKVDRTWHYMPGLDELLILAALGQTPTTSSPLSIKYRANVPSRQTVVEGFLSDNLAYECTLPGNPDGFIFESGAWYEVKNQWKNQVIVDVNALMAQSPMLLGTLNVRAAHKSGETEDAYIDYFADKSPLTPRCLKLHRQLPAPPMPKAELCDVCIDGNKFLFFKRGTDRSACGDVAQQAIQTANALTDSDSAYLRWANQQLASNGWSININDRSKLTFCIVLMTGNSTRLPNAYTVRAMDALSNHLRDIEKLGFKAALLAV